MGRDYRTYSKTSKAPKRMFEKERLDKELQLVGQYGTHRVDCGDSCLYVATFG